MRRFRHWISFRATSAAVAMQRSVDARRNWAASRLFELYAREFDELWPEIERLFMERRKDEWKEFDREQS